MHDVNPPAQHVGIALELLGIDFNDPNFSGTPERWTKYLQHYLQPYDPRKDLNVTFPLKKDINPDATAYDHAMVVQAGIPYRAVCAHHLLPVLGTAHVAYIPGKNVVGLSKLARLVYGISHASPSLQEDVCDQITDALMQHLQPLGAMCLVTAEHGCMSARGVEEASGRIKTITTSLKGVFIDKLETRDEFYRMVERA